MAEPSVVRREPPVNLSPNCTLWDFDSTYSPSFHTAEMDPRPASLVLLLANRMGGGEMPERMMVVATIHIQKEHFQRTSQSGSHIVRNCISACFSPYRVSIPGAVGQP